MFCLGNKATESSSRHALSFSVFFFFLVLCVMSRAAGWLGGCCRL